METEKRLQQVCKAFRVPCEFGGYEKIKDGNVNQTYKVYFNVPEGYKKAFIVQKVNTYAFRARWDLCCPGKRSRPSH